ncbi:MAG TPA: translocation/assembly module TamB domain-containing protein [Flavobacteriales bacterium]|nr:translocation/assembly module TamB domain-containing protein [Flavobacteriales bacterium]HRP80496.1 translocation/assembly module TamB domain-containing protein [Flavobacteriales bacterium]
MAGKKHKVIRPWRTSRRVIRVVLVLCVLLGAAGVALLLPVVQTELAQRLAAMLSEDTGARFRIGRVELRLFGPNRLHGVLVEDLKGDTLIAADEIWVRGLRVHAKRHLVQVRRVELHRARFALARAADEAHSNLTELLNKLSAAPTAQKEPSAPWTVRCGQVDVRELHFSFHDDHYAPIPFGVDLSHVDIATAKISGRDLLVTGDSILFTFAGLSLTDHSGLVVDTLQGKARVSPAGVKFTGLHLVTGPQRMGSTGSNISGDIDLRTKDYDDFSEFTSKVFMEGRFHRSRLQFADVALFAPDLEGVDHVIELSGQVNGRVNSLKGRDMDLRTGGRSYFKGDVEMTGLPDFANTFIVLDAERAVADPKDLGQLPMPPFKRGGTLQVPAEVQRAGPITFAGNFTGFMNSFTTYGTISTALGTVQSDISYERDTTSGMFDLKGKLATGGFDLGQVLGSPALRRIAMDVKVSVHGRDAGSLEAEIDGEVPELGLEHYTIRNIALNGKLEKNLFNGELHCNDPKLLLDFNGLADLRGRWPEVDFVADVHRMDLRALGLIGGAGYSDLQMRVDAKGLLAPDSLQGRLHMRQVSYCHDTVDLDLGDISLEARHDGNVPVLELVSTVADAKVQGPFLPTHLPEALQSTLFSVFPSLSAKVEYDQKPQNFSFTAVLKHPQPVLDLVLPGMKVGDGAGVSGRFDSRNFDLTLDARLPAFAFGGFGADSLHLTMGKTMDLLAFSAEGIGQVALDSIALSGLYITGKAYQDEVGLAAKWAGSSGGVQGTINLNALVQGPSSFSIELEPSSVDLGQGVWHNDLTARIQVDSTTIVLDTLVLHNGDQFVGLGGTIGRNPAQALSFELLDVRSENLKPLYNGPVVHGLISGDGRLFNLYNEPYLLSYLCVDSLAVENHQVGDLRFAATYREEGKSIDVNGSLQRGDLRAFDFTGRIEPGAEQQLALRLSMDRFDLRFIDPYLPSSIGNIQGKVSGQVSVTGRLDEPQLNGYADLEDAGLRIDYLNTSYHFTHRVNILPDMFAIDQVKLLDDEGNWGVANGTVIHHGLKDWNFDVNMDMAGLKVLDTDANNNELYYGKAYATGMLGISGYTDNLEINVDAATGEGTDIHFPLGASQEVGGIPFVHFTELGSTDRQHEENVDLSGIRLDMKVAVTPQARFELIFDPTVGDIMRGRGSGNLAMTVTPSGDFSMNGDVELVDGDYLFTLRNLVNKRFGVEPGGHITWYGDPFDAIINVGAVYRLRTSLFDVIPPALRTEAYKKRFPVEVHMHLSQKLMNPDIGFEVKLPTVDEAVRTQVNSALATTDDLNKQVFALIVLNRFLPSDAATASSQGGGLGGATSATGTELLSNQVSNWLSSFSSNLDLGVNWRTGDAISQDEVEVAVSTAIFNDRLQLNTNVGVAYGTGGTAQGANSLIGDFSAEYSITQDGRLRFKAFSQSNDRNLNMVDQAHTTQGVGLAYRQEFNTWKEFFHKLGRMFRRKKP